MFELSIRHIFMAISIVFLIQTVWSATLPPADTDTPSELHEKPASSQVSGPSIFWALLALALNAMTQPSAFDKGLSPANLLFPGHSSPIMCFMDASNVMLDFYILMVLGKSAREAAALINWRRAQERLGADIQSVDETAVEKRPLATVIIFIGPLSQAIKLFGCEGIPLIKVVAGMYLSSYIVLTLAAFLAPPNWRVQAPISTNVAVTIWNTNDTNMSELFEMGSMCSHGLFYFCLLRQIASGTTLPENNYTLLLGLIIAALSFFVIGFLIYFAFFLYIGVLYVIVIFLVKLVTIEDFKSKFCYLGMVGFDCLFAFASYAFFPPLREFLELTWTLDGTLLLTRLYCVIIFPSFLLLDNILGRFFQLWKRNSFMRGSLPKNASAREKISFAIMNLVLAIIFFAVGYDGTRTMKPGWTDRLG